MLGCRALGLLSHTPFPPSSSLLATVLGLPASARHDNDVTTTAALARLRTEPGVTDAGRVLFALRWLGLLGGAEEEEGSLGGEKEEVEMIDAFCRVLERRLAYEEGERDMIAMRHDVEVDFPMKGVTERHTSTLLTYGDGEGEGRGYTAMAKTVGWTAALAVGMLLDGRVDPGRFAGVRTPLSREVYEPLLAGLAGEGVRFEERVEEAPLVVAESSKGEGEKGAKRGQGINAARSREEREKRGVGC